MTDYGATDTSTTSLGTNQFPVSAAWVPNDQLRPVGGAAAQTDGGGKKYTAVLVNVQDGYDVTQGSKADARSTATDSTAITIMQVLKQISYQAQNPASTPVTGTFWQATQPVSGTVTANAGSGSYNNASVGTIGSTSPTSATEAGGTDGTNLRAVFMTQAHNADNQTPPAAGYSFLVSTNSGTLNPAGTVDRARGTGQDAAPLAGIPSGAQQLIGPSLSTTFNGAVTGSANAQSVVVVSSANAKVGDIVLTQDNAEYVEITAIADATHVTGIFKNNHASGQSLTWYHANMARDATVGDNVGGTGISPSATYLYNQVSGNFELDRSANGEKDGASGQGTAVAAEYEYNANPLANGSVLSGLQFDRARNVQGGGLGSGTISNNPLAANSTTLTLNSAPTTLDKGMQIILDRAGANPETNYVATSYTPGSTSVPLQIATQFSHAQNATVEWSQHASLGPQLNGFLPSGLGMEEEIVYDPVSKKYYIEIAATGDANSGQNIVLESAALYNGSTFDRARSASGDALATTGIEAASEMLWNGSSFDRARSIAIGDGAASTGIGADGIMLYNGSTYDRLKDTLVAGAANVSIANTPAVTQSGTWTVQQGGSNWSTNVAQIGGTNVVTGGANGLLAVGGPVASGATNADNPLKIGGAFNTTQPTVTNGQIVDAQYTARGAAIVSTGVDTFNVTVNAALPTGANTIGAVTQASGPWSDNLTQVAGSSVNTAATGTLLVGVADGTGNKITTNSTTYTSKFGLDGNLLGTLGTAFSTAGKVDVKGADGDVFVRQATAANLNMTATQGGTWTVQPGNTANTTPWLASNHDGTNKQNVLAATSVSNAKTAQAAALEAGAYAEQASLSAGSLNADLVPSTDVSNYKSFSVHINTNAYSGTLTFQGSNDNSNWVSMNVQQLSGANVPVTTTTSTNVIFVGAVSTRYIRVRMTSYTSGTAQGTLELYTYPLPQLINGMQIIDVAGTNVAGVDSSNRLKVLATQTSTWTVQPGNTQNTTPWLVNVGPAAGITAIASAAYTTTQTQADQTNVSGKGILVYLNVTSAGTGSITLEIDGKDPASGTYYALLTGVAVTANGFTTYRVYPGLTAAANSIANDVLPTTWRIKVTANNANSITYSVGAVIIP